MSQSYYKRPSSLGRFWGMSHPPEPSQCNFKTSHTVPILTKIIKEALQYV